MFGGVQQLLPLIVGGGLGGLLGWRILRARVWHSFYDEAPVGMSRRQYARRRRRLAHLKTAIRASLCAMAGMAVGWGLSRMIP